MIRRVAWLNDHNEYAFLDSTRQVFPVNRREQKTPIPIVVANTNPPKMAFCIITSLEPLLGMHADFRTFVTSKIL